MDDVLFSTLRPLFHKQNTVSFLLLRHSRYSDELHIFTPRTCHATYTGTIRAHFLRIPLVKRKFHTGTFYTRSGKKNIGSRLITGVKLFLALPILRWRIGLEDQVLQAITSDPKYVGASSNPQMVYKR